MSTHRHWIWYTDTITNLIAVYRAAQRLATDTAHEQPNADKEFHAYASRTATQARKRLAALLIEASRECEWDDVGELEQRDRNLLVSLTIASTVKGATVDVY